MPTEKEKLIVFWFWKDLRLGDNPALYAAVQKAKDSGSRFLPVFILDDGWAKKDKYNIGSSRRKVLSRVLSSLAREFERFQVWQGQPLEIFQELSQQFDLELYCNDDLEPYAIRRHRAIFEILGRNFRRFKESSSIDLTTKAPSSNRIYSVFTPFKKRVWESFLEASVLPRPDLSGLLYYPSLIKLSSIDWQIDNNSQNLESLIYQQIQQPQILKILDWQIDLDELGLEPEVGWVVCSEKQNLSNFEAYTRHNLSDYNQSRNSLELDVRQQSSSQISPALAFGMVSARQLKELVLADTSLSFNLGVETFLSELVWREFYKYILYHYPWVLDREFQVKKQNLAWVTGGLAQDRFLKWIQGKTGYDIVDAGMKQIAKTGWMHNRTRMIVASILSKNLGLDWRWGQELFRMLLVDLDEASNNGGWQWGASVGADPKPIRIFNPYLQASKFDPNFEYRFQWLGKASFQEVGGKQKYQYTLDPIIEHSVARKEALIRYGY